MPIAPPIALAVLDAGLKAGSTMRAADVAAAAHLGFRHATDEAEAVPRLPQRHPSSATISATSSVRRRWPGKLVGSTLHTCTIPRFPSPTGSRVSGSRTITSRKCRDMLVALGAIGINHANILHHAVEVDDAVRGAQPKTCATPRLNDALSTASSCKRFQPPLCKT